MKREWNKNVSIQLVREQSVFAISCVTHLIYLCRWCSTTTTTLRQALLFYVGFFSFACHMRVHCVFSSALFISHSLGYDRTVYICTLFPFRIGFISFLINLSVRFERGKGLTCLWSLGPEWRWVKWKGMYCVYNASLFIFLLITSILWRRLSWLD